MLSLFIVRVIVERGKDVMLIVVDEVGEKKRVGGLCDEGRINSYIRVKL